MIQGKYLQLFCCLFCKGELRQASNNLVCNRCNRQYGIRDGIPRLLKGEESIDVQISTEKWDNIYAKDTLEEYKTNNIVLSQRDFLSQYKQYINKGVFLDLGCGIALQSLFLAQEGVSIVGIDISVAALAKSADLFKKEKLSSCFLQANFLELPLKDNSVQFIYWGLSIEYARDTKKAVKEAYRVLKKGGRIIVPFPVASFTTILYHQFRGGDIPRIPIIRELMEIIHVKIFKGKYMNYGYGQTFTVSEIEKIFKESGFRIQKIGYYDICYPLVLVPTLLRAILRNILHLRPFWPFAYIEATK